MIVRTPARVCLAGFHARFDRLGQVGMLDAHAGTQRPRPVEAI